ncbi:MAG: glycogen synthase [Desulfurivibrionaceae bacterium]
MYITMIATECAPFAKVGGLADVVYGLSRELEVRGNSVEIILPKYDCGRYDHVWDLTLDYHDLWVPWFGGAIHCSVFFGFVHGRKCFFIEPHSRDNFFNRDYFYGYPDETLRMAFFSKAALEFMLKAGKRPDIIHCHDWQTGLVPVMLFDMYKNSGMENQRACYTIHNFGHQGLGDQLILSATGLDNPHYYLQVERLRDEFDSRTINFMKSGIVYANFVTTVSPSHAWEVRHSKQSQGLGHTLHVHQNKFGGVLNGLDYEVWNPQIDPFIPQNYGPATLENKYANKDTLRNRFLLRKGYKPVIAYIGRLDRQKGVHLIRHGIFYALANGAQFVLLGSSPDQEITNDFLHLKHHLNESPDCHLEIGFSEELAHLIYAGADMIIVPSLYEPCGLTQLIALKYGTVPIVRSCGGLADTVFDCQFSDKPQDERNGFVFYQEDPPALESAVNRALGLWNHYPAAFKELIQNGMKCDYSWNLPGQHYLNIYDMIRS